MTAIDSNLAYQFDHQAPASIEAEMCVLGSMMLDKEIIPEVASIIDREHFFQTDHQVIFDALMNLHNQGRPIDSVILRDELAKRQLLDDVGGAAYLGQILGSIPSSAHGVHYARIVREKFLLRRFIGFSNDLIRRAYGPLGGDADDLGAKATSELAAIMNGGSSAAAKSIQTLADSAYWSLEQPADQRISLGIPSLDALGMTVGPGETMFIGARPSMGKSILAKQIAIAVGATVPVVLLSTEESGEKIARNMLANLARVENGRIRRGGNSLDTQAWNSLAGAVAELHKRQVTIIDNAFSLQKIKIAVAATVAKTKAKVVLIDHMHRIQAEGRTPYERASAISLELSILFKQLQVAGVVMAQLNREGPKQGNRRPTMTDLRESGQIEQDADQIILLHREDYYHLDDEHYLPTRIAELIIAKYRDGARGGVVKLRSNLPFQKFEEYE